MACTTDPDSTRLRQTPDWNPGFVRKARKKQTKQGLMKCSHHSLFIGQVSVFSVARHASGSSITQLSTLLANTKRKCGDLIPARTMKSIISCYFLHALLAKRMFHTNESKYFTGIITLVTWSVASSQVWLLWWCACFALRNIECFDVRRR